MFPSIGISFNIYAQREIVWLYHVSCLDVILFPRSGHSLVFVSRKKHLLGQLGGARLGEGGHPALAGTVLAVPRVAGLAVDAGHIHDGAAKLGR